MNRPLLLSLLLFPSLLTVQTASAQERGYLSAGEILKLMDKSTSHYGMNLTMVEPANVLLTLFPASAPLILNAIVVTENDGTRRVQHASFDSRAMKQIEQAEVLFGKEDYAGASPIYLKATEISRACYPAWLYAGDCAFFQGDYTTALGLYEKALAINPLDYQPHFFRAHALLKMGRRDEALASYINTLALNPRHNNTMGLLNQRADELHIALHDPLFSPVVLVVKTANGADITLDMAKEGMAWMVYGMAKAMWLGEPSHRKAVTGREERSGWTPTEEAECLGALAESYLISKDSKEFKRNEQLEVLVSVIRDGYLDQYIAYEIGSRVDPNIMVQQSDAFLRKTAEFIAKYVVVKKK